MKNKLSKKYIQWAALSIIILIDAGIWFAEFRADRRGMLTVAFLDVGQGDAIYIEAPNGNQVLIDGGPSGSSVMRSLGQVMPFYDHSIDLVLVTHPDQDHVGGLPTVLERMDVRGAITTENRSDTETYRAFEKIMQGKNVQHLLARSGERFLLDNGVTLEILYPTQNVSGWETNKASVVARLSYGAESFLFTGDAPQSIEKYLAGERGDALHANVLKLGHHGSRTSNAREFLSAVNPEEAVISAGLDNKYGHPHKEVLNLLAELGISAVNTIDHGTIIYKTNGVELSME